MIFAGGWGPEGNQASLEAQASALSKAVAPSQPVVLFAGPKGKHRTVQVLARDADEVGALLALAFDHKNLIDVTYRQPRLQSHGAATAEALLSHLERAAAAGRSFIGLGLGHGSLFDDGKQVRLDLWGPPSSALTAQRLTDELARMRPKAPVAFVLGQCHSGGFTEVALQRADAGDAVCVLAAIPRDREASGCTPDISDPSARSYMAMIAEALSSPRADLDRDRRVSLAEAHAYARIEDLTIDVPVSTREAFLRRAMGDKPPSLDRVVIDKLIRRAPPTERAVLTRLRPRTKPNTRVADVSAQLEAMDAKLTELDRAIADLERKRGDLQSKLRSRVIARWPELGNPYHRASRTLLAGGAPEVVAVIRASPELKAIRELDAKIRRRLGRYSSLSNEAARVERWLRAAEIVEYERRWRPRATAASRATFARIVQCEGLHPHK